MSGETGTPLRVLISGVVLSQPMGGVRRHNAELLPRAARHIAETGGTLSVLEGRQRVAIELPLEIERLPSNVPASPPILRATFEGRALSKAVREAAEAGRPFDLVHTAHLPVPRSLPVPYTLTLHDLRSLDLAHTPLSRRLFARGVVAQAVEGAAAVFTVSETVRARILESWRVAPERVRVVPNAADHFTPLPRDLGEGAPILHVGHIVPRKNLELLIQALAADPSLPPLRLAGASTGGEEERLIRLASELGVDGRVVFSGPFEEDELPRLYAEAACVALPSHLEGFGIAVLEAQRARAPLAVSDTDALAEIAGEGVPRFATDDPAACARAIRLALGTDEETLTRHAHRALRFTWAASARAWVDGWRAAVSR